MPDALCISDALIFQPRVQLGEALHPRLGTEHLVAQIADLVLDLTLLPSRSGRAGHGLDQVMRAHLQKAAIISTRLADEDRFDRRLHVVVDAAPADPAIELERFVMGVEHQLLGLPKVDAHKRHAAVRQLHVRRLDRQRQVLERDRLVAPVELVGFPGREAHRHVGMDRNPDAFVAPGLDEPMHAVVGAVISAPTQLLEQPLGRAALPLRQIGFLLQDLRQHLHPVAKLRRGLNFAHIFEIGLVAADDLAHRRARHRQRPHDLFDGATLLKIGATYLADQVHANHRHKPSRPIGPKGRMLTQHVRRVRNWMRKSPSGGHYCARFCMREDAHRLIVRALAATGRKAEALKHYQNLVALLKHELNTEPDAATRSLVAELQSTTPPGRSPAVKDIARPSPVQFGLSAVAVPFADNRGDPGQELKIGNPTARGDAASSAGAVGQGNSSERRQLTIMACNIVDSMALSARLDPEDMRDLITSFHNVIDDVAARFDGFVAQYLGDGVLLYFGYPAADEHDTERAVRAGLAILEAVGSLKTSSGVILQASAGIATGLVG